MPRHDFNFATVNAIHGFAFGQKKRGSELAEALFKI